MANTARLKLPLLETGQSQKEVTHNEALLLLDLLIAPAGTAPTDVPPGSPQHGSIHICGPAPSGAWQGRAHHLAIWTAGGWRFAAPTEGQRVADLHGGPDWHYRSGQWARSLLAGTEVSIDGKRVIGPQLAGIAAPNGGSVIDVEARNTVAALLEALRTHGLIAS